MEGGVPCQPLQVLLRNVSEQEHRLRPQVLLPVRVAVVHLDIARKVDVTTVLGADSGFPGEAVSVDNEFAGDMRVVEEHRTKKMAGAQAGGGSAGRRNRVGQCGRNA